MKTTKEQIYAVAYCYESNNNQQGTSIDTQLKAIRQYAKDNNIVIIKEYCDTATNRTLISNCEQYKQMAADAKTKEFSRVIVYDLGSFGMDRYDAFGFKFELKKNKVKIISVIEEPKESPEEQLLFRILDGFGELFFKCIFREIKKIIAEETNNSNNSDTKYKDALDSIIQFFITEINISEKCDSVEKVNE